MEVKVLKPGLLTTVQDLGRTGYRAMGMPLSGAVDATALKQANWLVGNALHAPALEIVLGNIEFEFRSACQIAFTGGEGLLLLNHKQVPYNITLTIQAGDTISLQALNTGNYAYMSITGGWQSNAFLGSHSTHLASQTGGLTRSLIQGDILSSATKQTLIIERKLPPHLTLGLDIQRPVRFIPGPEYTYLSAAAKRQIIQQVFTITAQSNRMGMRLHTDHPLKTIQAEELISSPVFPGVIQLPPTGQPIVLLNDGQSIGGYPRIGTVIQVDLPYLAQQQIGQEIQFRETTRQKAVELLQHQAKKQAAFLN